MVNAAFRLAVMAVLMVFAVPLWADDQLGAAEGPEQQKKAARPAHDPVEEAFALPPGVTLRRDQVEAYQQMRSQLEPLLRGALAAVESNTDEKDKLKAVAEVKRLKEQIRQAISEILAIPPPNKSQDAGGKGQGKNKNQGKKNNLGKKKGGKKEGGKKKGGHGGNRGGAAGNKARRRPQPAPAGQARAHGGVSS